MATDIHIPPFGPWLAPDRSAGFVWPGRPRLRLYRGSTTHEFLFSELDGARVGQK